MAGSVTHLASSSSLSPTTPSPSVATAAAGRRMTRALSDTNLLDLPAPKRMPFPAAARGLPSVPVEEEDEEEDEEEEDEEADNKSTLGRLLSSSGLDRRRLDQDGTWGCCCAVSAGARGGRGPSALVVGDGCAGGGGKICGGGRTNNGGDRDGDGDFGFHSAHDRADAYYRTMIDAKPRSSLLLGNYARFLKEDQGDVAKSQEYCERAILANPGDAGVSMLNSSGRPARMHDAPAYFDQAVQDW